MIVPNSAFRAISPAHRLPIRFSSGLPSAVRVRITGHFMLQNGRFMVQVTDFPGWPRIIHGRADLMAKFKGYGKNIELQSADQLITHKADSGRILVIEYEVHGTVLATGVKYNNRFCSIIHIENQKISHWRDYMDSLAAWNVLTGRTRKKAGRSAAPAAS
ncbi:MAG: nuclear transport factor 2 family protein [Candidatus Sulfopaludibacter sp.]|nr:nuclear transport factor 2 family protein [Candidatus Sulfopaludibacter sp.]